MRALRSSFPTAALLTLSLLAGAAAGHGQEACAGRGGPAATLLVPYFEVDLETLDGRTTLFSVANADSEPTLARVVLWTNLGIPTLAFDVLVRGDGVVTVNLRDVFAGRLPVTGADPWNKPESCAAPLALPDLSGPALADLAARHTGGTSSDGLCYGQAAEEGLAVGYVTVDVMDGCLAEGRVPGDGEPYFLGEGFGGLAAERNVLWGDAYLIDSTGNRAEGFPAVAVPADPSTAGGPTFYGTLLKTSADRRRPLPAIHRTRFLQGPGADTHLILWTGNFGREPVPPFDGRCLPGGNAPAFDVRGWNESAGESFVSTFPAALHSLRVEVGTDEFPVLMPFGTLELEAWINCPVCSPPNAGPLQSWVGTLTGAAGRYAVGVEAVGLGPCR